MAEKYLYFDGGSNNAIALSPDRLLAIDQLDDTSLLMTFEHVLGTSSSNTKVDLTIVSGTEKAVINSIVQSISFSKDPFVVVADSVNSIFINSSITAVSVDDSGANNNGLEAGLGITSATGETYHSWVEKNGNIIKTSIYIDIATLRSTDAGDIIGKDGTTDVCHIGQIVSATSGSIFAGTMTCLEAANAGNTDIDLYAANEGTGVESALISSLTETQLVNNGAMTIDTFNSLTAYPTANQYLYLVAVGATDADYDAGKFLIELLGTE